ncbi:hypothetical protein [Deinococcus psychrotolerans]|uniref:hypothetical protein n=1 Tax=Deinococcus psychrotolerans TaxID=2489213 RepID=UPI0013DD891B|nr:hypothetical protein [Deinococcus psychrotolerans]
MKTLTALLTVSVISLAAAQTTPTPINLATTATVSPASLSLSAASRIATLAVNNCAQLGYNVSATVVDPQRRDPGCGPFRERRAAHVGGQLR